MRVELNIAKGGNHTITLIGEDGEVEELHFEWFEVKRARRIAALLEEATHANRRESTGDKSSRGSAA